MTTGKEKVIAEAKSWLGTPFHHAARVKGVGVDCVNLLVGVFSASGLIPSFEIDAYPQDWHLHNDAALFLDGVLKFADPVPDGETPQAGDVAMFRFGRHAAHGAIIVDYPLVIHAWRQVGQVVLSEIDSGPLAERLAGFYRMRGID